jgi:integrase
MSTYVVSVSLPDEDRGDGCGRTDRVHKIKPASTDELAVLTAAMPERLQLMVLLASWCALRFGETVELRRGDIDLSAEVIRIRRAAVRINGAFQIGKPKSEETVRDVSIPPHLLPVIEEHLAKHVGAEWDSLLFPAGGTNLPSDESDQQKQTPGGKNLPRHLQPSTLARHWYKARKQAGRDDLRWHDLCHSGAVLAAATGASLAELMARLGHSTPQAAMRYQHAAQGRDREIAALLSKLANG